MNKPMTANEPTEAQIEAGAQAIMRDCDFGEHEARRFARAVLAATNPACTHDPLCGVWIHADCDCALASLRLRGAV